MVFSSSDSDSSDFSDDMGNTQCRNCKICSQLNLEPISSNVDNSTSSEKNIVKISEKTKKRIKNIDLLQNILVNKMEDFIYEEKFIEANIFKENIQILEEKKVTAIKMLQNADKSIEKLEFKKANAFIENYKKLMEDLINFDEIKVFLDRTEKRQIRELIYE